MGGVLHGRGKEPRAELRDRLREYPNTSEDRDAAFWRRHWLRYDPRLRRRDRPLDRKSPAPSRRARAHRRFSPRARSSQTGLPQSRGRDRRHARRQPRIRGCAPSDVELRQGAGPSAVEQLRAGVPAQPRRRERAHACKPTAARWPFQTRKPISSTPSGRTSSAC